MIGREVGKDFAVKVNVGFFETGDKAVVRQVEQASGGADFDLPQSAKVALLLASALESVHPGVLDRFFGGAEFVFASPLETLSIFQYIFSSLACLYASFDSCHGKR